MPAVSHAGIFGASVDARAAAASRVRIVRTAATGRRFACCLRAIFRGQPEFGLCAVDQAGCDRTSPLRRGWRRAGPYRWCGGTSGSPESGARTKSAGVASFYSEDSETASGEKFDPNELTAAHPSLPFGAKLRVANEATGKSVTVRVNDRGPYVSGHVVNVSARRRRRSAWSIRALANVTLDVMR